MQIFRQARIALFFQGHIAFSHVKPGFNQPDSD